MKDSSNRLPFDLNRVPSQERQERHAIIGAFPGTIDGLPFSGLSEFLRLEKITPKITEVKRPSEPLPNTIAAIALSSDQRPESYRTVLGFPLRVAHHLVDLALRRPSRPHLQGTTAIGMSPGEQGALLYALDIAGGDWIASGGRGFVIRSILADGAQVPDYLGGYPQWQISFNLRFDGMSANGWFWLGPLPRTKTAARKISSQSIALWETKMSVCAGWSNVSADDANRLEKGDCVVLDTWNHPQKGATERCPLLISGKWQCFGRWLDNHRIEVISHKESALTMDTKTKKNSPVQAEFAPSPSGGDQDMEVQIRVEVGEIKLTVAEAQSMVPGRILTLNRDVGPEVVLKVGDRQIAKGELVDYEGTLSVDVKEIT